MADEGKPTETVPVVEGGPDGAGAGTTPEVVETPEQKQLRELQEQNAELAARAETQRQQLAQWQPKVEAFNTLQKATGAPGADASASPTGTAGGTLEQQLEALYAEYEKFGLVTTANQIRQAEAAIIQRNNRAQWNQMRTAAQEVFGALSDKALASRALAIFDQGSTNDPQLCIDAARARVASEKKPPVTPTKTSPAEAATVPDTTFAGSGAATGGPTKMPESEYERRRQPGVPGARKLVDDVEKGRVVLVYGQ